MYIQGHRTSLYTLLLVCTGFVHDLLTAHRDSSLLDSFCMSHLNAQAHVLCLGDWENIGQFRGIVHIAKSMFNMFK